MITGAQRAAALADAKRAWQYGFYQTNIGTISRQHAGARQREASKSTPEPDKSTLPSRRVGVSTRVIEDATPRVRLTRRQARWPKGKKHAWQRKADVRGT